MHVMQYIKIKITFKIMPVQKIMEIIFKYCQPRKIYARFWPDV